MKITQIPGMKLAVMLTLVVAQGLGFISEARAGDGKGIEGTWQMEITFTDCDTGEPIPIPGNPFPALMTYTPDGSMLETGASPPPPPPATSVRHSSSAGIWERTGDLTFRARFRQFDFDRSGVHVATIEVTQERSLRKGNQSKADEIFGPATAKVFTPGGVLIATGCSVDKGTRFEFE